MNDLTDKFVCAHCMHACRIHACRILCNITYEKGVGGWGKCSPDAEAVGGAKVFLCPPAGGAQESRWLSRIDCHVALDV